MKNLKILFVSAIIIIAGSFGFAQENVITQDSGTQDLLSKFVPVPGNDNILWATGRGKVVLTENAGDTWEVISLDFTDIPGTSDNPESANKLTCGGFVNEDLGFFGGERCLFKYEDGSFINKSEDIGFINITSINCLSDTRIIASGYDAHGKIFLSEDAGDTWSLIFQYGTTSSSRVCFLGGDFHGNSGIIVGSRKVGTTFLGMTCQTNDGGNTWTTTLLNSGQLKNVEMIDENIAIASANSGIVPLIKTIDGGSTWDEIDSYGGTIGLHVTSENEIFTTHNNWRVASSVNNGTEWEEIFGPDDTDQNIIFYDVYSNGTYLWATGWYGTILRWDVASYKSMMYGSAMGIKNIDNSKLSIYPNPAIDQISISSDVLEIKIYDITGKVVFEKNNQRSIESIDISEFKTGTYIVSMKNNEEITKEILIKK